MSIGIQQCVMDKNVSLEQLVTEADGLMYEQKRAKRRAAKS